MANLLTLKKREPSALQKYILSLAEKQGGVVLAREVLIHCYGFIPARNPNGLRAGALVFDKTAIGVKRYNSKTVTVCKAFNRLVNRGLAVRIIGGIRLVR